MAPDITAFFYYQPMRQFGVRELARLAKKDTKTVMKYLKILTREGLVLRAKEPGRYVRYEANRLSRTYKLAKGAALLEKIGKSGLIDRLENEIKPKAIVLFGSAQKGTYLKDSDIDLFIQAREKPIRLTTYERAIGHELQLFFEEDLTKLTEGLRNNIINGSTLTGALQP